MPQLITQHELKKNQADIVKRIRRGESFTVTHRGEPVALLSPATSQRAPSWDALMAPVYQAARAARARGDKTHPNPVLAERARHRR